MDLSSQDVNAPVDILFSDGSFFPFLYMLGRGIGFNRSCGSFQIIYNLEKDDTVIPRIHGHVCVNIRACTKILFRIENHLILAVKPVKNGACPLHTARPHVLSKLV